MSNRNLIVIGFIILFLPVSYYFFIALPNHNNALQQIEIDKLEYQKEQDRKQEKYEVELEQKKQEEKRAMEEKYYECIDKAEDNKTWKLQWYCKSMYDSCMKWNSIESNYWSNLEWCEQYNLKWKGECSVSSATVETVEASYQKEKDYCNKRYPL